MPIGRCLCGSVSWTLEGPFRHMSHCHCSRCRKTHGAPFATWVGGLGSSYRLNGEEYVVRWESMPGFFRCFCRKCGSVVPNDPIGKLIFVPAGNFDEDPGVRPEMHIFAAFRAPWFEITDALTQFETYPPGVDFPVVPDRAPIDAPGKPRGSCLCGAVGYVVEGEPLRAWFCHCSRCRRAGSAAFAANLFTRAGGVRFTRGADLLDEYKLSEAKHYKHVFCRGCGSSMPRVDPNHDIAVIPMGALDDDPGVRPQAHLFVDSMAPWDSITDSLPQHGEYPPRVS